MLDDIYKKFLYTGLMKLVAVSRVKKGKRKSPGAHEPQAVSTLLSTWAYSIVYESKISEFELKEDMTDVEIKQGIRTCLKNEGANTTQSFRYGLQTGILVNLLKKRLDNNKFDDALRKLADGRWTVLTLKQYGSAAALCDKYPRFWHISEVSFADFRKEYFIVQTYLSTDNGKQWARFWSGETDAIPGTELKVMRYGEDEERESVVSDTTPSISSLSTSSSD